MDEKSQIYDNPRAGAIAAVMMYVLLACVLAVLFCWRVASTTPQGAKGEKSQQPKSSTTEKK